MRSLTTVSARGLEPGSKPSEVGGLISLTNMDPLAVPSLRQSSTFPLLLDGHRFIAAKVQVTIQFDAVDHVNRHFGDGITRSSLHLFHN